MRASPVASSIDSPDTPVSTQRATFAATPSGSSAYPAWKSAFTGTEAAATREAMCSSTTSTGSASGASGRPRANASPALVVASALKPSDSSARTVPTSHGFGMTKQPLSCSARNEARMATMSPMIMPAG